MKPAFFLQSVLSLLLCISISACKTDLPVIPNIQGLQVSPSTGYTETTEFTFTAEAETDAYDIALLLWSPNINNEWDWLIIPMDKQQANHYSISKGLAEYSANYKYKYGVQDRESGEILLTTDVFYGPHLTINNTDQTAPEILRTNPENKRVGVSPSQEIHFIFDEVIDPDSVSSSNISLSDNSNLIANITAYQNRVIVKFVDTFEQSYAFSQTASEYSMSIAGVTDLNGNEMAEPYAFDFYINSPLLQTWSIESRKYPGNCITVKDIKKRFADPQVWNPVVELIDCVAVNADFSQRWFFVKAPGDSGSGQIRWSANYDYCLSKRSASDPIIERCDDNKSEQRFSLDIVNSSYHQIISDHGGCVAAGIVDIGDKNKIESSLCDGLLEKHRNHWKITARELQELSPAFMLGRVDVRFADIKYENPLYGVNLSIEETRELVKYLYQTNALNQQQIHDELQLIDGVNKGDGYETSNPYFPRYTGTDIPLPKPRSVMVNGTEVFNPEGYDNTEESYQTTDNGIEYFQQEAVTRWFSDITHDLAASKEVCAIQFTDETHTNYNMRTFTNKDQALLEGWIVTHQYHCGVCSTLKDLAVYMGVKDQTTPNRICTKRGRGKNSNLDEVKQCIQESVGLTSMCAESWAYNAMHTGQECRTTCMKTYGNNALFWPRAKAFFTMVIAEKFNACPAEVETPDPVLRAEMQTAGCPLENEITGKLNACLWCDEKTSGSAYKYAAGRSRRGSGLESAIPRPNDRLYYEANHTLYFQ